MGRLDQLNLIALEAALEDEQSGRSVRVDVLAPLPRAVG
ncbi:uncharacterized protein SOCE26_072580 [Sorangium cellulosum]|uniref:Uncharacterized protein n=1 Tax=Sorangium cellulosum TaxID=56 RepID=A0A2L0F2H5_SORCE|nr:uncharacterized protein SOCE26_072580 [Sorangium cellulosum]